MVQNDSKIHLPNPLVKGVENFILDIVHATGNVASESIEATQKTIYQMEELGKTIPGFLDNMEHAQHEFRATFKGAAKEATQDVIDVLEGVIHGAGQVVKTALSEVEDIAKAAEELQKDIFGSLTLDLFKKSRASQRSKEPTIIPITIQDN